MIFSRFRPLNTWKGKSRGDQRNPASWVVEPNRRPVPLDSPNVPKSPSRHFRHFKYFLRGYCEVEKKEILGKEQRMRLVRFLYEYVLVRA
jgi:hypothetical protein